MSKKNGRHQVPTATVETPPTVIAIGEEDAAELRDMSKSVTDTKLVVADLQIQFAVVQQRLAEATTKCQEVQDKLHNRAVEVARDLGINVDDPEKEQWNLNTTDMVFLRVR